MKAWIVFDSSEDWYSLFHADTQGKAKLRAMECFGLDEFLDMRAKRIPKLDDKPITYQNAFDAGWQYRGEDFEDSDEDGYLLPKYFPQDCRCEICKRKEAKNDKL